ncbi:MAG: OmpA family protein, partial [Rhodovibrionaceae bacterium]|nr:OmpA family protein [Rhodovibrionaceae bacterium]
DMPNRLITAAAAAALTLSLATAAGAGQGAQRGAQLAQSDDTVQHQGPREVTVYFDFNETTLSLEAQQTLNEFFRGFQLGGQEDLVITGYADRAGPAGYNLALSKDRAQAVHDFIEAIPTEEGGVTPGDLEIKWLGENAPALETGDGVRAQENRRVTVRAVQQSADE